MSEETRKFYRCSCCGYQTYTTNVCRVCWLNMGFIGRFPMDEHGMLKSVGHQPCPKAAQRQKEELEA